MFEGLPVLADRQRCAVQKGALVTRKKAKGRKQRAEKKVKDAVRAACEIRDGYCRVSTGAWFVAFLFGDTVDVALSLCDGASEHAHMHARRRSKTRGMAPEIRHDTQHSLMLCRRHHLSYDGKQIVITALTRKGAEGALKFRMAAK